MKLNEKYVQNMCFNTDLNIDIWDNNSLDVVRILSHVISCPGLTLTR